MIIQKMRCHFFYNIPVDEPLLSVNVGAFGVTPELIQTFEKHFDKNVVHIPAFYTKHYRYEHTPYQFTAPDLPSQTYIPRDRLQEIGFFADIDLPNDLTVTWDFCLPLQTAGLVTICVEAVGPIVSRESYHLSGLHLNPEYTVIATEPIKQLWKYEADSRPEYVVVDDLARIIRKYYFQTVGLSLAHVQALRHEIKDK